MKLAFCHIPKTAGLYVRRYLRKILPHDMQIHRIRDVICRTEQQAWSRYHELTSRTEKHVITSHWFTPVRPGYKYFLEDLRDRGYETFQFVRHPGDLLCSAYHYCREMRYTEDLLFNDTFDMGWDLEHYINQRVDRLVLDPDWREHGFCRVFSDHSMSELCHRYFGHDYSPDQPFNTSRNRGYEHYRATKQLGLETIDRIEQSQNMVIYREIASGD